MEPDLPYPWHEHLHHVPTNIGPRQLCYTQRQSEVV